MAAGDLVGISLSQGVRAVENADGSYTLQVITTSGVPTSTVVSRYIATAPSPGVSAGDTLQSIANYNVTTGALISETWQNLTTGLPIGTPPPGTYAPQASSNPYGTQFFNYQAIGASALVNVGDIVQRAVNTDLVTGSPVTQWVNITTGVVIPIASAPPISTLTSVETLANQKYLSAQYLYTVTTAFGGNNVGDTMSRYDVLNGTTVPPTLISTSWTNVTTGAAYLGPVSYPNLAPGQNPPSAPSTAGLINATGVGSTTAGAIEVSFANIGAANAIVAGTTIFPGTAINYQAGTNGSIAAIAYDATGTTLSIATLI